MSEVTGPGPTQLDERLAELIDVVVGIASNDFDKRATIGDGSHLLDGLASGLNMLAEEIGQRHARERAYQQRLLQQERLLAVGQLAAGVAHEINNPASFVLTNLGGLEAQLQRLERALGANPDAESLAQALTWVSEAREWVRDDIAGVERVVAIVRELRNFARLEPERLESLSIDALIHDASKLVRAELSYRARFIVRAHDELRVKGDRTKLVQVFTNLLINAAQAIPEGASRKHEVMVETRVRGVLAVVTVRDTGAGLTSEAQARLFEPFFTTKPREYGTGLGLALSADIVRHHGGQLRLVETSPQGTTFEVTLPLDTAQPVRAKAPEPALEHPGRPRVMIVDDEPMLLQAYGRFFGQHFELTLVSDGRDAITELEKGADWDAIVCDLMMPDFDGVALHDWVMEHQPGLLPRTLFYTGGAFTPRGLAFAERLGDRLLQKPLRPSELRAAVDRVRRRD